MGTNKDIEFNNENNKMKNLKDLFKLKPRQIAYLGIYLALIIAFSMIVIAPNTSLGYWTIVPNLIVITVIPIVVGVATLHLGILGAMSTSLFFGFFSFIFAITFGGAIGPWRDFWTLVIPRLFIGITLSLLYWLLDIKNKNNYWKSALIVMLAPMLNTVFITIWLYWFYALYGEWSTSLKLWISVVWMAALVEWGLGIVVGLTSYSFTKYLSNSYNNEEKNRW